MSKRSEKFRELIALRRFDEAQQALERWTKRLIEKPPRHLNELVWPFEQLAILYRKKKDYDKEIELLKIYVDCVGPNPLHRYEQVLVERLQKAQDLAARFVPDRGQCEMCDTLDRKLTRIDSGHRICETCRRTFLPPPRKKHWASLYDIVFLRAHGFDVPNDLTKAEANRLYWIHKAQYHGFDVDINATDQQIDSVLGGVVETFETPVSGVCFDNSDGTSRQLSIYRCRVGEEIDLIRDPSNPFDPLAVKVCRIQGSQIGYLSADVVRKGGELGRDVASLMDRGSEFTAKILDIHDFEIESGTFLGVVLAVSYHPYFELKR